MRLRAVAQLDIVLVLWVQRDLPANLRVAAMEGNDDEVSTI